MTTNPYESPRSESLPFTSIGTSSADLERRVAELERQVARSWLLRSNLLARTFAVWGYFLLGYAMLAAIAFPIVKLTELLMPDCISNWPTTQYFLEFLRSRSAKFVPRMRLWRRFQGHQGHSKSKGLLQIALSIRAYQGQENRRKLFLVPARDRANYGAVAQLDRAAAF